MLRALAARQLEVTSHPVAAENQRHCAHTRHSIHGVEATIDYDDFFLCSFIYVFICLFSCLFL